jgi:hypothetical protein
MTDNASMTIQLCKFGTPIENHCLSCGQEQELRITDLEHEVERARAKIDSLDLKIAKMELLRKDALIKKIANIDSTLSDYGDSNDALDQAIAWAIEAARKPVPDHISYLT